MKVAVIGAGKMGLPIACQLAGRGASVQACDVNPTLVATLNRGECPFEEPGLASLLQRVVAEGRFTATTDTAKGVSESDVVIVIVPVLLTPERKADLRQIHAVSKQIGQSLKPGALVIFETTLPVGTTRSLIPLLESGGKKAGMDFHLVFSPERVKSRFVLKFLVETPKVVGGLTPEAAAKATAFYREYLGAPVMDVGSPEAAELVKLAGMVYRDVNIALANEIARYADAIGVEFGPIAAAANTDGEAALLTPGIGVGGHCTPVYPYFMLQDATQRGMHLELTDLGRRINDQQPRNILTRLESVWKPLKGRRVSILGLGFRPEVKEHTCSPAFQLRDALLERGANVELCDPLYSAEEIRALGFTPGDLTGETAPEAIILVTAHDAFLRLDFAALAKRGLQAAVDGRNVWDPLEAKQCGVVYLGIGTQGDSRLKRPKSGGVNADGIPIAKPVLDEREAEGVRRVILKGWVTQGPEVARFEKEFANFTGAPYACAVSNCTTALHLALRAVGVQPGDEVITVSHSFIATANAVRYCGAIPVFVDIDRDTYNLDPALLEPAITERTKAILCVHQIGMPCDMARIVEVAKRRGIPVIEDAACAIGSEILWNGRWETIGRPHGDIACFSFHPRKVITTGDGGMLTTANPEYDRNFRLWRQHGMSVPDTARHGSRKVIFESYPVFGYNYRMTDVQAAIGREQLGRLPEMLRRRREIAQNYQRLLNGIPGLTLPVQPSWARTNWQSYCVRLPEKKSQMAVMQAMLDRGIATRRGVMCAHRELAYQKGDWRAAGSLTQSESAQENCVLLPIFHQLDEAQQETIATTLKAILMAD